MSEGYEEQIDELLEQASGLDNGPTKVALLEEAVRLADTHQRPDLGYLHRRMVIEADLSQIAACGSACSSQDTRLASLWFGESARTNQCALEIALALAV
jgi:hypothetical protein